MKVLVIGVGNDYRGDDAAGLIVARRLRAMNLPDVQVIESDGEFTRLMESWKEAEKVILIDAVQSGAAPGTIHRFDANKQKLPASLWQGSTHAFGVAEAIAMAQALGRLPRCFMVFGIEAQSFELGAPLSVAITRAMQETIQLLLDLKALALLPLMLVIPFFPG
jgi:hydrogenase maturation protease